MKFFKYSFGFSILLLILLQTGCMHYPAIREPDISMFDSTVYSENLRDSLKDGKLTAGMPHFVLNQLFRDWTESQEELKIPVASPGSKQRLEETEGWGRKYVDPGIKVFLDEYDTPDGRLYVWYRRPDFYSMEVSSHDTLCIFYEDSIICSPINYLNNSTVLTSKDSFPEIPVHTALYAEIRYKEHPWREVSYWYKIEILSNAKSFKLDETDYDLYPVELLELDNEPVTSFKWREANNNEN